MYIEVTFHSSVVLPAEKQSSTGLAGAQGGVAGDAAKSVKITGETIVGEFTPLAGT
jgi:hypothetical protein